MQFRALLTISFVGAFLVSSALGRRKSKTPAKSNVEIDASLLETIEDAKRGNRTEETWNLIVYLEPPSSPEQKVTPKDKVIRYLKSHGRSEDYTDPKKGFMAYKIINAVFIPHANYKLVLELVHGKISSNVLMIQQDRILQLHDNAQISQLD